MNGLALPAPRGAHALSSGERGVFGLSLCAGAGGLDLGLHLALPDYRTICYVERESFAASTIVARMENKALDQAPVWDDVKTFDGKPWRGIVDILHGGYPCQPFSVAGKKLGEKDPRHLWPDIAKIVRTIEPPICFFENVGGHLRLGFEQVHDDLSEMGYRVKAGLFTAEEVGAPHKRERLFILAYREGVFGKRGITKRNLGWQPEGAAGGECCDVADSYSDRLSCSKSQTAREDDPQGRTQCFANTEPCRNSDAAKGFPLHEAGSGKVAKRQGLQNSEGTVADTEGERARKCKQGSRQVSERSESELGNTNDTRLERWSSYISQSENRQCPWPPGPTEQSKWKSIPANLKPAVCRMADGMAHRVDRLRTCGNGVVPLAAAYAFCTLATQAITENGTK